MNEAQTQLFLEQSERAFITFQQCTPEFIFSEDLARQMAEALKLNGLDPRKPEHLSLAWSKVRTGPAPEPADNSVEAAARALLLDATFLARVREMTAEEFERACHDPAFALAVELSEPPSSANRAPTRGEMVREAGTAELVRRGEIIIAPYDPATEVERSRREFGSSFANHQEPKPQPQGGVPHWSGMSFGDRRAAQPRRREMTLEEARANETANAARLRQPEKPRGEAVREAQEREGRAKQERLNR